MSFDDEALRATRHQFAKLGRVATYYAVGDDEGVPDVQVIESHEAQNAGLGLTDAIVAGLGILVQMSDVAEQPEEGARFVLADGTEFKVRTSRQDLLGNLYWSCDVDEVPGS